MRAHSTIYAPERKFNTICRNLLPVQRLQYRQLHRFHHCLRYPVMPAEPSTSPCSFSINTPPGTGTNFCSGRLISEFINMGRFPPILNRVRDAIPNASDPQALPTAICGRKNVALSATLLSFQMAASIQYLDSKWG